MVSNARLDLPEPDSPVITTRRSRGKATSTFLRLCSRAPRTTIRSWGTCEVYRVATKWNSRSHLGCRAMPRRPGTASLRADEAPHLHQPGRGRVLRGPV